MTTSRRRFGRPVLALVVLVTCAFAAMASLATSAQAAPYTSAATIALGSQVACASESVQGSGFGPGTVTLSLQSASLGSVTVASGGTFSTTVTLPSGIDGTHTIVAAQGSVTASVGVTVDCGGSGTGGVNAGTGGSGTSGSGTSGSGTSGGLSNTGVAVIGIGSLGLILVIGGGVLLLAGKRRRVSA